jgi:hypothetical protein
MANDKQKLPEGFVPDEGQDLSEFVPDASAVPPSQEGTMEAAPSMLSRAGSFLKGGHPLDALGAITTEPLEKAGAEMKMRGQGTPSELANIYATEGGALAAPEDALAGVKMIEDLPKMGDMLAHVVRGAEAVLPSKVKGWIPGVEAMGDWAENRLGTIEHTPFKPSPMQTRQYAKQSSPRPYNELSEQASGAGAPRMATRGGGGGAQTVFGKASGGGEGLAGKIVTPGGEIQPELSSARSWASMKQRDLEVLSNSGDRQASAELARRAKLGGGPSKIDYSRLPLPKL